MGIIEAPLAVLAHSPLRAEHAIGACSEPVEPISLHGLRARTVCQAFEALSGPSLLDGAQMAHGARRNRPRKGAGRINGKNWGIKGRRHPGLGGRQGLKNELVLGVVVSHWDRRRGVGLGINVVDVQVHVLDRVHCGVRNAEIGLLKGEIEEVIPTETCAQKNELRLLHSEPPEKAVPSGCKSTARFPHQRGLPSA